MKTKIFPILFSLIVSPAALAQTTTSSTIETLKNFEGVYQLVGKQLSAKPQSTAPGVCYEQILVEAPRVDGSPIDLQIFGMPLGQGNIVVQMTSLNEGEKTSVEKNPMTDIPEAIVQSEGFVQGSQISYHYSNRDLNGDVRHSTNFTGSLVGKDGLQFRVHKYRSINGFEDSTSVCHYTRTQN